MNNSSSVSSVPSVAKTKAFQIPVMSELQKSIARDRLHALASSSRIFAEDLRYISGLLRAGKIPADQMQGLRTHIVQLRRQITETLDLIPLPATPQPPTPQPVPSAQTHK